MQAASVSRSVSQQLLRVKNAELSGQLRAAALEGDDAGIARLLSQLLRFQGLTKGQRVSLQLHALLNLVHSLRDAALTDELTGLYNRRGFLQSGTRLLDVAARDGQAVHLVYFDVNRLAHINATMGRSAGDVMLRQLGNLMRDLYPNYGVYEVLGRLRGEEFAALTTGAEYASRSAILLRTRRPQAASYDLPQLSLSIGVAHFNPQRPVAIDELLQNAEAAMYEHKRVSQIASSELTPHPV
jgi:diguanylate cyclase (GGDEF)-like protein